MQQAPTTLLVRKMVCGGCVGPVERALLAVVGVASVAIDLPARQVTVVGEATVAALVAAVEATGRDAEVLNADPAAATLEDTPEPPPLPSAEKEHARLLSKEQPSSSSSAAERSDKVTILSIGGMSCSACVAAIEGSLLRLDGVASASVSLLARSGRVRFDERVVSLASLLAAVESSGFTASASSSDAPSAAVGDPSRWRDEAASYRRLFTRSLPLTLPVLLLSLPLSW